jgi:hypothetical protein
MKAFVTTIVLIGAVSISSAQSQDCECEGNWVMTNDGSHTTILPMEVYRETHFYANCVDVTILDHQLAATCFLGVHEYGGRCDQLSWGTDFSPVTGSGSTLTFQNTGNYLLAAGYEAKEYVTYNQMIRSKEFQCQDSQGNPIKTLTRTLYWVLEGSVLIRFTKIDDCPLVPDPVDPPNSDLEVTSRQKRLLRE